MLFLSSVQSEDLKQIPFSNVLQIASAFGLEEKIHHIRGEQVKVCYYRKPSGAPDELVVVVR